MLQGTEIVNVVIQSRTGGSFAMEIYAKAKNPVAVEEIKAGADIDIGKTLIVMQLKKVTVPVRLSLGRIGETEITCARTRPKFVGGSRAVYDGKLSG